MTAAHCVESGPLPQFVLGQDRNNPDWVTAANGVSIHPLFATNIEYNVALVRLASPATGYTPVRILRPWQDQLVFGQAATLVGYGIITPPSGTTPLRHSGVVTFDDLQSTQLRSHISSGSGACFGDSGAPALIQVGDLEFHAGGVSTITGLCDEYTFYVRTSAVWDSFLDIEFGEVGVVFADGFETGTTTFWGVTQ